jgi:hypothetical protein
MAQYVFIVLAAVLTFVVFILQSSSFVWIYALIWMFSGSVSIALITALFFGSAMFTLVSFPSFFRKIKAWEFRKNLSISKLFLGNTLTKE